MIRLYIVNYGNSSFTMFAGNKPIMIELGYTEFPALVLAHELGHVAMAKQYIHEPRNALELFFLEVAAWQWAIAHAAHSVTPEERQVITYSVESYLNRVPEKYHKCAACILRIAPRMPPCGIIARTVAPWLLADTSK